MPLTYSWKIIKTKKRDLSIKIGGDIVNFNNAIINIEWEKIGTDENGNSASQIGLSPMRAKRTIDPAATMPPIASPDKAISNFE